MLLPLERGTITKIVQYPVSFPSFCVGTNNNRERIPMGSARNQINITYEQHTKGNGQNDGGA